MGAMREGLVLLALTLLTGCAGLNRPCCRHGDCPVTKTCVPEVSTEKVTKDCWDVECEQICIPPVRCPWTKKDCSLECGTVIAVRRLKPVEIDCGEECVVDYKLVDAPCCHGEGCAPESILVAPPQEPLPPPK